MGKSQVVCQMDDRKVGDFVRDISEIKKLNYVQIVGVSSISDTSAPEANEDINTNESPSGWISSSDRHEKILKLIKTGINTKLDLMKEMKVVSIRGSSGMSRTLNNMKRKGMIRINTAGIIEVK